MADPVTPRMIRQLLGGVAVATRTPGGSWADSLLTVRLCLLLVDLMALVNTCEDLLTSVTC